MSTVQEIAQSKQTTNVSDVNISNINVGSTKQVKESQQINNAEKLVSDITQSLGGILKEGYVAKEAAAKRVSIDSISRYNIAKNNADEEFSKIANPSSSDWLNRKTKLKSIVDTITEESAFGEDNDIANDIIKQNLLSYMNEDYSKSKSIYVDNAVKTSIVENLNDSRAVINSSAKAEDIKFELIETLKDVRGTYTSEYGEIDKIWADRLISRFKTVYNDNHLLFAGKHATNVVNSIAGEMLTMDEFGRITKNNESTSDEEVARVTVAINSIISQQKDKTTKKLKTWTKKPSFSELDGSEAIANTYDTYIKATDDMMATANASGTIVPDGKMAETLNTREELRVSLKMSSVYEDLAIKIMSGDNTSAEAFTILNGMKEEIVYANVVNGVQSKGSSSYKKYTTDGLKSYLSKLVTKQEKIIENDNIPMVATKDKQGNEQAGRLDHVRQLSKIVHDSNGMIKSPLLAGYHTNTSNGMTGGDTIDEVIDNINIAKEISKDNRKRLTDSWVVNDETKERADVFLNNLKKRVDYEGTDADYKLSSSEAMNRWRAFEDSLSRSNKNQPTAHMARLAKKWEELKEGDIKDYSPGEDRLANGVHYLLAANIDQSTVPAIVDSKYLNEKYNSKLIYLSNDFTAPWADKIGIVRPAGMTNDKNAVDKIFGRITLELKGTKMTPDDFESTRLSITQSTYNGENYIYVTVMDKSGSNVLNTFSLSDSELLAGASKEEKEALKELGKAKGEAGHEDKKQSRINRRK